MVMQLFLPERVFFEPASLKYPLGQELFNHFKAENIPTFEIPLNTINKHIPGDNDKQKYARAKKTLVVAVRKTMKLDNCKPSADFSFAITGNCPGNCEYCYLHTTQGYKPYIKIYVNIEDIFNSILKYIELNHQKLTTFEVASNGDPLAIEHITGQLSKTIEFFGALDNARLRIVTKYDNVDQLLDLKHNGHTRFRFSVNSRYVIDNFEHNTSSFNERITAASKISKAGYPLGFIVAPIMVYDGWKEQYQELFYTLKDSLSNNEISQPITFELIQHRFTSIAKQFITQRYPGTKLDMDEEKRMLKWGKFGRFKYVYTKQTADEIKTYISSLIYETFDNAIIEYFT